MRGKVADQNLAALAAGHEHPAALVLPSSTSLNTVIINARCTLRVQEDQRVIMVAGLPVHHSRADDMVAEAYAMVLLVELGFAQQSQVARAFGRSERTVRRHQERCADRVHNCAIRSTHVMLHSCSKPPVWIVWSPSMFTIQRPWTTPFASASITSPRCQCLAAAVHAAVTHVPLAAGLGALLETGSIDAVVTTDSVGVDSDGPAPSACGKLTILPIAPLLGHGLARMLDGRPLASLLERWPPTEG